MALFFIKDFSNCVDELNKRYCKRSKNKFGFSVNNGDHFEIFLTGKTYTRGNKNYYRKGSLENKKMTIASSGNPIGCFNYLKYMDSKGRVKGMVKYYENKK
ncbi:MAG: hypothetical protein J1F32_01865 [Erysipelotrichales bacterium]|nr:hypothetical protein [Erysipelotrichales bacterium]